MTEPFEQTDSEQIEDPSSVAEGDAADDAADAETLDAVSDTDGADEVSEVEDADEAPEAEDADEVSEVEDVVDEPAADPLTEFRDRLHSQFGDWFVVHTYAGMEKRVKTNLENRITSLNMEDFIFEVVVPTEEVAEIKNGQRKFVTRTRLPGYVLVRMDLTDDSWAAVRHTPSVTGFVGNSTHRPVPLSLAEVEHMLAPSLESEAAPEQVEDTDQSTSVSTPSSKPTVESDFNVGDSVMVVAGPFATMHATITELNYDAQKVKALVEIFGRETPVELEFNAIERL